MLTCLYLVFSLSPTRDMNPVLELELPMNQVVQVVIFLHAFLLTVIVVASLVKIFFTLEHIDN